MKSSFKTLFPISLALAVVNAIALPNITTQPVGKSVSLGANVMFQVKATGAAPLSYQWRLNTVDIPQATTSSLALTGIQLLHAGDYVVVVTDASGSVTSKVATLQVDPTFTKITDSPIVNDGGASSACAWGDYDNDGWLDLFVNSYNQKNFLYRNKRDGTFERVAAGHMVSNTTAHLAGIWGDYDNDGYLDLLGVNGGAVDGNLKNFLYHNNGDGTFTQPSAASAGALVSDAGGFHGAAWGDYDGDGFLDVFVANFTGSNRLYRNKGGTNFVGMAKLGSNSAEGAWADYDNDGDLDLVLVQHANSSGKDLLYRNDGQGGLTQVTTGTLPGEGASASGIGWGDYDNDGLFDLFVSNFPGGRDLLYHNKGDGTFDKITDAPQVNENADTYGAAWGDYDNDGFLDLFVANGFASGGPLDNFLFRNKGDGSFEKILVGSLGNDKGHSIACAWADYDNNGFLDLFVANDTSFGVGAPEKNFLYRNNGNPNNWLKVHCVGTVSNRGGIGAKVRVKANYGGQDRWQLRQISSSDGRTGGSLEANFGIGDATIIDTLRIEWPSGIEQEFHDVSPKQSLTITEPARLQASDQGGFRIQSWKGMAFEVQSSTDLGQWSPVTTVTNLTGTLEFTDPSAANDSGRFYRTVLR